MSGRPTLDRARAFSLGLAFAGLVGLLASGTLLFEAWYTWWSWAGSDEHRRIERQMDDALPRPVAPPGAGRRSTRRDGEDRSPHPDRG